MVNGISPIKINDYKTRAFTLIEVALFIAVIGIVTSALAMLFATAMENVPDIDKRNKAIEIAQQRMDIILGQKANVGFASFTDPCVSSPPAVCNFSGNYTVTSSITTGYGGNNNFKLITVSVTGDSTANLTSMVGNY